MRVLYLPGYNSDNPYLTQLQRHLAAHDVEVVIPEGSTTVPVGGVSLFPVLGAFRRHGRPDVLHLHWVHPFLVPKGRAPWLAVPLAIQFFVELIVVKLLGVRLVWTVHNLADHEGRAAAVDSVARRALARLADAVIVHSEAVIPTIVEAYRLPVRASEKVVAVQHGHYLENYTNDVSRADARGRLGVDDDATVFLYFGRVRRYKNVPELLRTFRALPGESLRLFVVGNPHDEALAAEIRRLATGDERIRLVLEFVPDDDVQLYMNAADAVVLPFSEVLTSGSTILAMSFGRPVVVPALGCVADLTAHDPAQVALTYDPADPDGLRHAMERALSADVSAIGAANRARIDRLDWRESAARTAAVYRGTPLPEPPRAPPAVTAD